MCLKFSKQDINPLTTSPTKWTKETQTIRRFLPTNCFSLFDYFVGLPLKGLRERDNYLYQINLVVIVFSYFSN